MYNVHLHQKYLYITTLQKQNLKKLRLRPFSDEDKLRGFGPIRQKHELFTKNTCYLALLRAHGKPSFFIKACACLPRLLKSYV
jgi:hypothetical protein